MDRYATTHLALVVDRSGSMERDALRAVGAGITALCARGGRYDRLTLISYAEDVTTHCRAAVLTSTLLTELCALLADLPCRGATDLAAGWVAGCQALLDPDDPPTYTHLLLLTDGYTNSGLATPAELTQRVRELRRLGVHTSTCGIGYEYDGGLLAAIARAGDGRFHPALTPAPGFFFAVARGARDNTA